MGKEGMIMGRSAPPYAKQARLASKEGTDNIGRQTRPGRSKAVGSTKGRSWGTKDAIPNSQSWDTPVLQRKSLP